MNEEYLTALGLEEEKVAAIMAQLNAQEKARGEAMRAAREALYGKLIDRAGVKGSMARRAVLAAMMEEEDALAVLDRVRKEEPQLFARKRAYGAMAMTAADEGVLDIPFHRVREGKG